MNRSTSLTPSSFSPSKLDKKSYFLAFVLFSVGAIFACLAFVQPPFFQDTYISYVTLSANRFELKNEETSLGKFSKTGRVGDTTYSLDSTFYGVSVLSKQKSPLIQHVNNTRSFVKQLQAINFNHNLEQMFQGLSMMTNLRIPITSSLRKKYFKQVLSFQESQAGFRLSSQWPSSAKATSYAFSIFQLLGKMEHFTKKKEYLSSVSFIQSLQEEESKGFKNSVSESADLPSTWFSLQILRTASLLGFSANNISLSISQTKDFVLSCQLRDGGFIEKPVESGEVLYYGTSSTALTSQALWILKYLQNSTQATQNSTSSSLLFLQFLSFLPPALQQFPSYLPSFVGLDHFFGPVFRATSFLRCCLSFDGLSSGYRGPIDLESSFYFLLLVESFPELSFGLPVHFFGIMLSVAFILWIFAIFYLYSHQLKTDISSSILKKMKIVLFYLVAGSVALQYSPELAVIVYLLFSLYLAIEFYETSKLDLNNDTVLIAVLNTALFLLLPTTASKFFNVSFLFAQLDLFYLMLGWCCVTTFLSVWLLISFATQYLSLSSSIVSLLNVAFQAWVLSIVSLYSFLYGRGDMEMIMRVVQTLGHYALIFVFVPFASFCLHFAFTCVGSSMLSSKKRKAPK